jgi:hypothetical protein
VARVAENTPAAATETPNLRSEDDDIKSMTPQLMNHKPVKGGSQKHLAL